MEKPNPNLVLPVGTQVVTLVELRELNGKTTRMAGTVANIVRAPADNHHSYTIRFGDGKEASIHRQEMVIRKHMQSASFDRSNSALVDRELHDSVIYRCVVGSRAFGLDDEHSDTDRRGIYLPSAELHWSLYGVPEQIEDVEAQECYWEMQKFLVLALKANPNVLECLYTPLIELASSLANELLENRQAFLSKLVYQTYNGYVLSQFKKLDQDIRTTGAMKCKHAMHLIRLLISGVTILEQGFVPVRIDEHRDRLLSIKRGDLQWDEINEWRLKLHKSFDNAFENSTLPERPDFEWANAFLIKARKSQVHS
ncbi:MAG: nucleotidyltransferase domain-containing protein [Candidatus Obscuribacterales bacterium]|nr:nucleotidyltransferase domain-containing protein [Candidatus Obscuribacterales bacterium]